MSLTLREISRNAINPEPTPLRLRQVLRLENADLHLQLRTARFSIMT